MASKAKRIAQRHVHGALLGLVEGEIKLGIQIRIVCKVIDRRRDYTLVDGHQAGQRLNRPGTHQQVASQALV